MNDRAMNKKDGSLAAKDWIRSAPIAELIAVAACDLEYGETLESLVAEGYQVPLSRDRDYSWGFYKKVKSHVYHAVYQWRIR